MAPSNCDVRKGRVHSPRTYVRTFAATADCVDYLMCAYIAFYLYYSGDLLLNCDVHPVRDGVKRQGNVLFVAIAKDELHVHVSTCFCELMYM